MQVLGLPGNPTSSTVCAVLFLRPLLRALHGEPDAGADPTRPARLGADMAAQRRRGRTTCAARSRATRDGRLVATPAASQDSSLVKVMARADGLIVRRRTRPAARAGDACRVIAFERLKV